MSEPVRPSITYELFARYLGRLERGEEVDIETFCAEFPEQAERLRELEADRLRLESLVARHGLPGALSQRIKSRYGAVDPRVTLRGETEAQGDFGSELLRRLAHRNRMYGRYRLKGELARGGQGAVLRVWDEDLRRNLAMKVVLGEKDQRGDEVRIDPRTLGRFLEEAQVTGQLDHPGIVPVHELGLDPLGRLYFTMKLVKGRDLLTVFDLTHERKGGWTLARALSVMQKVCDAMSYAHSKGVIHRDLKPGNVMVGRYGEVFVMDWGLARVLDGAETKDIRIDPDPASTVLLSERRVQAKDLPGSPLVTMEGDVVGTPAYMAPEQADGRLEEMGPHSDVYSVGAMLYHLFSGQTPYVARGSPIDNYAIWVQVQKGPPRRLAELAPNVAPELVAICEKAMAREPAARYADMSELSADLADHLEGRVVHAYEAGARAELRKWVERNRFLSASVAGALIVLVAVLSVTLALKARSDDRAREAVARAERSERLEGAALRERDDALRLAAFRELEDLRTEADELWPPHPGHLEAMDEWLVRARRVVAGLEADPATGDPGHRGRLAQLRRGDFEDQESTPEAAAWWAAQLERLVAELEAFADPATGLLGLGVCERGGWGIEQRVLWAREIATRSIDGPDVATAWEEVRAALADSETPYGGLELEPQLGLVPLGRDPRSGLLEFAHLATGEPPERGRDGTLRVTESTGLVFALIPAGSFVMGGREPDAEADELPAREVTLSPYFLSKYEMTQGQWRRLTGKNPARQCDGRSFHGDPSGPRADLRHPVEQVSWTECDLWLRRFGLVLPTEAQWEHAARARSETPWCSGPDPSELAGHANLADAHCSANGGPRAWRYESWSDGHAGHAPVGSFAPNAFGLHDVHGNVLEWCLDAYAEDFYTAGGRVDPVNRDARERRRVHRGGGYHHLSVSARSSKRFGADAAWVDPHLGLRPARPVEGGDFGVAGRGAAGAGASRR